jgi:hypothetical protein
MQHYLANLKKLSRDKRSSLFGAEKKVLKHRFQDFRGREGGADEPVSGPNVIKLFLSVILRIFVLS